MKCKLPHRGSSRVHGHWANTDIFMESPGKQRDTFSANRISCFSRFGQAGVPVSHPLDPQILHSETLAPPDAKAETNVQKLQARKHWNDKSNAEKKRKQRSLPLPTQKPPRDIHKNEACYWSGAWKRTENSTYSFFRSFYPLWSQPEAQELHFHMLVEKECFGVTPGNLQFNGLQNKSMLTLRFSRQIRSFKVKRFRIALTAPFCAFAQDFIPQPPCPEQWQSATGTNAISSLIV